MSACPTCGQVARPPRRRDVYAEEVPQLLSAGLSPEQIAAQLGTTVGGIARALYRAKLPQLARPFERAAHYA